MAKNSGFDFGGYFDQDALSMLIDKNDANAPTKDEVDIVTKTEGDVELLPLASLVDYHNHTYKVLDNEDMDALVDSIKDMGIILPILVRKIEKDKYEVISGHRRKRAAAILGLEKVPCKIVEADDASADIMMVDTNLHREEISPSEKARSYEVRIKAMKEKGLMPNDTDGARKYEEELAKEVKSSRASIFRYRKLLDLDPSILEMVDEKKVAVNAGAKIAALSKEDQKIVVEAMKETGKPLTMDVADKLVTAAASEFSKERAVSIFTGDLKPRKRTPKPAEIKEKDIAEVMPKKIKALEAKDKARFVKACIEEYLKTHSEWEDVALK